MNHAAGDREPLQAVRGQRRAIAHAPQSASSGSKDQIESPRASSVRRQMRGIALGDAGERTCSTTTSRLNTISPATFAEPSSNGTLDRVWRRDIHGYDVAGTTNLRQIRRLPEVARSPDPPESIHHSRLLAARATRRRLRFLSTGASRIRSRDRGSRNRSRSRRKRRIHRNHGASIRRPRSLQNSDADVFKIKRRTSSLNFSAPETT